MNQNYDLEDRLLNYSVRIIRMVEKLPNTRAGKHAPVLAEIRSVEAPPR
jgi:hypothetical protein